MSAQPIPVLPPEILSGREPLLMPTLDLSLCALLLDVDGTLLPFAAAPDQVRVDAALMQLLTALREHSAGAVALVSGRGIADMDRLFAPLRLPASGLHGMELRDPAGQYARRRADAAALQAALPELQTLALEYPGLLVEDKGEALALHYRQAPQLATLAAATVAHLAHHSAGQLAMLTGPMVYELASAGSSKADGVSGLMHAPPLRGRRPVYLGDDVLDEPAFTWVNAAGGVSVAVGAARTSAARWRLPDVASARAWLTSLLPQVQP